MLDDFPGIRTFLDAFRKATGVSVEIHPLSLPAKSDGIEGNGTDWDVSVPVQCCNRVIGWLVAKAIRRGQQVEPMSSDGDGGERPSACQRDGVEELLHMFASQISSKIDVCALSTLSATPACVGRAQEFIRANFHEPLSLTQMAKTVGLCPDHFGRVFSLATGLTFTEYLLRTRVEKAKELLGNRQQRVSEVAFASGFQSIPHFNRVFKRMTGMAPNGYRAERFMRVSRRMESDLGKKKSDSA
jgi:transcriptional regulator GlxA family with amidase domain